MSAREEESPSIKKRVLRKITLRLVPYLSLLYFMAYLDRVNVGNAHLSMTTSTVVHEPVYINGSLSNRTISVTTIPSVITETQYGWAVSAFFFSYMVFEAPSNMLLKKTSGPVWFSRIMLTWGVIGICTMFITNAAGLISCRFFLGVAEAGFFPGVMYYLSTWYAPQERAIRMGYFYIAAPLSGLVGGILGYLILQMEGIGGLHGWQWLFLIEGIPSVIFGCITWLVLPDNPENCKFLTPLEKQFVTERLKKFTSSEGTHEVPLSLVKETILDWRVWMFCIMHTFTNIPTQVLNFFLPAIVAQFGFGALLSNLLTAPLYAFAAIAIVGISYSSDKFKERPLHLAIPLIFSVISWILLGIAVQYTNSIGFQYSMMVIVTATSYMQIPPLWAWITQTMKGGTGVAVSTGIINGFVACAGIIGPNLAASVKSSTGSYVGVAWAMAISHFIGVVLIFVIKIMLENIGQNKEEDKEDKEDYEDVAWCSLLCEAEDEENL